MFTINQNLIDDFADKINEKEKKSNKVTSLSSSSTNIEYPSAKAVYDAINDLDIGGGGSYINDYYFDSTTNEIILDYTNSASGGGGGSGTPTNVDISTSWGATTSDIKVPSEKLTKDSLDLKADINHTHSQYLTEHQSLTNYVQKSSTSGLLKNDGTVDSTNYLSTLPSHNHDDKYYTETEMNALLNDKLDVNEAFTGSYSDLTNKPSYTATVTSSTTGAYKIGSINISGSDVDIYGKDTDTAPPTASTTVPSADATTGSYGSGTTYARSNHVHPKSSIYAEASHTHTSSQVTDLSIPTASTSVPGADTTSGSYGSGTSYARSNHSHPKSSIYAEATHNHTYSQINNVSPVEVTVTYTDNSTETIKLLKYTGS